MIQQEEESVADHVDSSLLGLGRAVLMSKKPRVPENFNKLPSKPRLKALKQVSASHPCVGYRLMFSGNCLKK